MKFCKDCKHFRALGQLCENSRVSFNLVTGAREPANAALLRSVVGACGPEGRWFELDIAHLTSTAPGEPA